MTPDRIHAIERFPASWVDSGEVTAVFAAVATPERVVWCGGAARSDLAQPGTTSLFDAASLTKVWMATLALRLAARAARGGGIAQRPSRRRACECDNAVEVRLAAMQGWRVARRDPPRRGQPQDGNARFLGGVAGHAGLFVTAEAMIGLGRGWLASLRGEDGFLDAARARLALAGSGAYALGWARRRVNGSAGRALPAAAFGHVGFTGTSLWIDPTRQALFVLLGHLPRRGLNRRGVGRGPGEPAQAARAGARDRRVLEASPRLV